MASAEFFDDLDEVLEQARSVFSDDMPSAKSSKYDGRSRGVADYAEMLYFVRHLDTNAIKIGRSSDPVARLSALKRAHQGRMELIGSVPGGSHEKAIHRHLERWALGREWFRDSPEVNRVMQESLNKGAARGLMIAKGYER